MHSFDIDIKNISKIEGHTHMFVKVKNGKVIECKLKVSENQRFCKTAIQGMNYDLVPFRVARICGTCSAAHTLASIEAIEKAFNVKVTDQTTVLRNLLMNASHLRDHAMHLYFFCLPDVLHKESIFDFNDKEHKWIHYGLEVKDAGNFLSTIVGGRAVHPPFPVIGGFTNYPTKSEIEEAIVKLRQSRKRILEIIDVFYKDKKTFTRDANYVAIVNDDYNYLKGLIRSAHGSIIKEEDYADHLEKVVLPYSTSSAFTWESKDFMVGALARINLNKNNLNKNTKKDASKYLKKFPSDCVFDNNLAQAIEMLQAVDNSVDLLEKLKTNLKKEKLVTVKPVAGVGVGVVEAPRGTLYYRLEIDEEGIIQKADLVIPTQQNIIHLEKDVSKYVEQLLKEGIDKNEISLKVEEMIRAYDPCMSCATHFLKIKWDES
jgi:coenzyme F420-reducing hydrogenase alpha subunit